MIQLTEMKLLSTTKVADILGFKPRTITRWCREGVFPSAEKVGRVWRIAYYDSKLHLMVHQQEEHKASQ